MRNSKAILTFILCTVLIIPFSTIELDGRRHDIITSYSNDLNGADDKNEVGTLPQSESEHVTFAKNQDAYINALPSSPNTKVTSDFPVNLTGKFSDNGVDTNSNGLFEFIEIHIELNCTQSFTGVMTLELEFDSYNFDYRKTLQTRFNGLVPGMQNYTFEFNPREAYDRLINTTIHIDYLSFFGYSYEGMMEFWPLYTTREYQNSEFDLPQACLTGKIENLGTDIDGDGLYDYLKIKIEINISIAGDFGISIRLVGDHSNYDLWQEISDFWESGTHNITFIYDFGDLYSQKVITSYLVQFLDIYDQYVSGGRIFFHSNLYTTRIYSYTEFSPPNVFLTGKFSDYGLDTDIDGMFNYLTIIIELNVTADGQYWVSAHFKSDGSYYYDKWEEISQYWTKGPQNISFNFEIQQDYSQTWNYSFSILEIRIEDSIQMIVDEYNLYTTAKYQSNNFDPPIVILTGNYWDQGFDSDENGKYNSLEIIAEINVTDRIPDYSFLLTISDARNVKISVLVPSMDIGFTNPMNTIGFHKISFIFDSPDILDSYNNSGSLSVVFDVILFRIYDLNMVVTLEEEPMYKTSEYYFSSFDPLLHSMTQTVTTDGITTIKTNLPKVEATPSDIRYLLFGTVLVLLLFTLIIKRK
ncbi:MAG: hypothetical protein ACW98F_06705 [Candidatus Hodarchaeales archaeon]